MGFEEPREKTKKELEAIAENYRHIIMQQYLRDTTVDIRYIPDNLKHLVKKEQ